MLELLELFTNYLPDIFNFKLKKNQDFKIKNCFCQNGYIGYKKTGTAMVKLHKSLQ